MLIRLFNVEHGQCAIVASKETRRIAMIDCGHNSTTGWTPAAYIRNVLRRDLVNYLFITNADQDHMSGLNSLIGAGVDAETFYKNPSLKSGDFERIKGEAGPLSVDAERYLAMLARYTGPISFPFDDHMGGIALKTYYNQYPEFVDTNNLSLVVFLEYRGFKIMFPGDLESSGWKALLERPDFIRELMATNVLVASHHGRRSGFFEPVFDVCQPWVVLISDASKTFDTQETVPDYRSVVRAGGVVVTGQARNRHVLTTRRDGDIVFDVADRDHFSIHTGLDR